jgi:hypothetical protein
VARVDKLHRASIRTGEDSHTSSDKNIMPVSPTSPDRPATLQKLIEHYPKTGQTPRRLVIYLENEKVITTTICRSPFHQITLQNENANASSSL